MEIISLFKSEISPGSQPELGPGSRKGVLSQPVIEKKVSQFLEINSIKTRKPGLVKALAFLWNDHLEAAHELSQEDPSADGSFIHAIMHRREPDYWNSKYWWRRVGPHPAFQSIAKKTNVIFQEYAATPDLQSLVSDGQWQPDHFVDLCEKISDDPSHPFLQPLMTLQELETDALLEHLFGL